MSKTKTGAIIWYCGHDASFVADTFEVAGAVVIRACGRVTMDSVVRPCSPEWDFHITDFRPCFWRPDIGVFVVPSASCEPRK